MDERNNHFDLDFTPIGQAIKKAREARGMTREQLEITFHHHNNGFVTGKLFNLVFQRFKPRKFTSLFSPVTADKLIPSVLF